MPFICTVCRDKLTLQDQHGRLQVITSTECGHIFHRECLTENIKQTTALQMQTGSVLSGPTCPTCQRGIRSANSRQIYPSEIEDTNGMDKDLQANNEKLQNENFMLKGQMRHLQMRVQALESSRNNATAIEEPLELPIVRNPNPNIVQLASTASGLKIGDLVVWFGGDGESHNGVVKWIGKIDNEMFTGIEFDETIGNMSYPEAGGRTLFNAARNRGRLIRTRELLLQKDFYGE